MTRLSLAARNLLVQTPEVKALITAGLLGGGPTFTTWKDGWIFADYPYANIEKRSHMALVVITQDGTWQEPNAHNTAKFPRLAVDIWASPTRLSASDPSLKIQDADDVIEAVMDAFLPYLHTPQASVPGNASLDPTLPYLGPPGSTRMWGTATQIALREGVPIIGSQLLSGPTIVDVKDGNGALMGRYSFGISTA